jgi:hypothetical protein
MIATKVFDADVENVLKTQGFSNIMTIGEGNNS